MANGARRCLGTLSRRRLAPSPVPNAARRSPCARRAGTRFHDRFSPFLLFSLFNSFFPSSPLPLSPPWGEEGRNIVRSGRSQSGICAPRAWHLRSVRARTGMGPRASVGRLRRVTKRSAELRGGDERIGGSPGGGRGAALCGMGAAEVPEGLGGRRASCTPPPVRCSNSGRETAACETSPTPGRRGPLWLPYVFNKIRQIGPRDRACSKPVVKEHKMGQCKRGRGPLGATPRRWTRPGASGSATRSPRGFLSRPRRYCAGSAPVGKHTGRLCAARGSYREAAGEGDVTMPLSRPPAGDVCPRPRD